MDPQHIELVQASFAKVSPIADQAAMIFYDELFERDSSLQSLFSSDLTEQRRKLMTMLGVAVNGLADWQIVRPIVASLGAKHIGYGVQPQHYATVGAALLATLGKGLGPDFTPEVEAAWTEVYAALSGEMQRAAATAAI